MVCVQYADADIRGSPFRPQVFDAALVVVGYSEHGLVTQPVTYDSELHALLLEIEARAEIVYIGDTISVSGIAIPYRDGPPNQNNARFVKFILTICGLDIL